MLKIPILVTTKVNSLACNYPTSFAMTLFFYFSAINHAQKYEIFTNLELSGAEYHCKTRPIKNPFINIDL